MPIYIKNESDWKIRIRIASHNLTNLYGYLEPYIKGCFEDNGDGMYSDYDSFMKNNIKNKNFIYLPKEQASYKIPTSEGQKPFVLFNGQQISQGSLPKISNGLGFDKETGEDYGFKEEYEQVDDDLIIKDYFWTDIQLGNLSVDENTTIAQFSQAVIENNDGFEYGDSITFIFGYIFDTIGFCTAKVTLSQSTELLSSCDLDNTGMVFYAKCFKLYEGKLACHIRLSQSQLIPIIDRLILGSYDFGGTWIHSRIDKHSGKLLVSTQYIEHYNKYISDMMTREQDYEAAQITYGYINDTFIKPDIPTSPLIYYTNSGNVHIDTEYGTQIYYTIDGTDPTTGSTLYTSQFNVPNGTIVKAIKVKNGVSSVITETTITL